MNVRLKVAIISDGKLYQAGTVMEAELIPERLRNATHIDHDLDDREGKVLLLRDLSFHSLPRPSADGVPTSYPVHLSAGELLDLSQVPASKRESLVAGLDYKSEWTNQEPEEIRKAAHEAYLKQFQTEPAVPTGWRGR